jgi:hypothetical protein
MVSVVSCRQCLIQFATPFLKPLQRLHGALPGTFERRVVAQDIAGGFAGGV